MLDKLTIIRLAGSILLLIMAAYMAIMNWGCVVSSEINRRKKIDKHNSTVPLISLLVSGMAYPFYPFSPKWRIGLMPLLDIGNWMLLIGLPWAIINGMFSSKPKGKNQGK